MAPHTRFLTVPREPGDRTDNRPSTPQYPWRDRSRDRPDQNDRGRGHRRRFNDQTPRGHRGALFHHGADPCVPRQCALSSRQDCPTVAIATRTKDRAAFRPVVLPASQSHRGLWALMHEHLTHNKTYPTCREFAEAILNFLRDEVPRKWREFCDSVTDNFRVILPANFRILA